MQSTARFMIALLGTTLLACGGDMSGDPDASSPAMDAGRADGGDASTVVDAGSPGCASDAECGDGVDCTEDTCTVATGACRHQVVPALCPAGSSCHPERGCEMGRPCGSDADCADDDACTVNERCDASSTTCVVDPLDRDRDGDLPRVCGGTDCDDAWAYVFGGAPELCDGRDNDCDGDVDDGIEPVLCAYCIDAGGCSSFGSDGCYRSHLEALDAMGCSNRAAVLDAVAACSGYCSEGSAGYLCTRAAGATCACPSGRPYCDGGPFGVCADVSDDPLNCGACDTECPLLADGAGARAPCEGGTCRCPSGTTDCGTGSCVDLSTSITNCGACGTYCGSPLGTRCLDGACVPCGDYGEACCAGDRCTGGWTCADRGVCCSDSTSIRACGGACVNISSDESHCGGCGIACATGAYCSIGECRCPTGATLCGGACVDTATSRDHCGSCGTSCSDDRVCSSGSCVCAPGRTLCSGRCADTTRDTEHCGGCGVACAASQACDGGACVACGGDRQPCCGLDGAGGGTCAAGFTCDALRSGLCWPS